MDEVNKPSHYCYSKYEVIDVLEAWFPDDPLLWQVGKYIARYRHKGTPLKDLKKAQYYLTRKINQLETLPLTSPSQGVVSEPKS
jgi:hypothetical protein